MNRTVATLLLTLGLCAPLASNPRVSLETKVEGGWADEPTPGTDWNWSPGLKTGLDAEALVPLSSDSDSGLLFSASGRSRLEVKNPQGSKALLAVTRLKGGVLAGWRQTLRPVTGPVEWKLSADLQAGAWFESLLDGDSAQLPLGADASAFWTRLGPSAAAVLEADAKVSGWRFETKAGVLGGQDGESAYGREGTDLLETEVQTGLSVKVVDAGALEARVGVQARYQGNWGLLRFETENREEAVVELSLGKRFTWSLVPASFDTGVWGWRTGAEIGASEKSLTWEASVPWAGAALTLGLTFKERF